MVSAEIDDVASAVEVAMYKLLLSARNVHRLFSGLLSVSKSCGAEAMPRVVSPKRGVDVPTPRYVPSSKIFELPSDVPPVNFARKFALPEPERPPSPVAERQVPFMEKHPFAMFTPLASVDVLVVPVRLRYAPAMPPANVEVPV